MGVKRQTKQIMAKTVFITGSTSGIGEACAHAFAGDGHRIIVSGRRHECITTLVKLLRKTYGAKVFGITLDVRNRQAVEQAIATLPRPWQKIDVLINNAGLALGLSDIGEGDIGQWDQMIDTNVKGLLYVSRAIIPGMIKHKHGHIINIGSIAGRETYPKGNVYCATKHAVNAITKGMRIDLLPHGIKVSQLSPGAVETEFSLVRFNGDQKKAKDVYNGFTPLQAKDVADVALFITSLPAHVNIDDLLLMPTSQAGVTNIFRQ